MELNTLLEQFERSMRRRELSPRTIRAYHWALRDLIEKAMRPARLTEVEHLTRDVLEDWQDSHIERGWTARSRGLAVTAARQLVKFGIANDYIEDLKLERGLARVKQPDPTPHPIPEEDLAKIKAFLLPLPEDPTPESLRDRALFCFILATGGRVSEILQARVDDYWAPTVIQKGGTRKTLGVPPEVCALVRDYLLIRGYPEQPLLWLSATAQTAGRVMTPSQVRTVWKKLSLRLGLTYWTTHSIRHTTATELLAAEVPHLVIAEHLGHHGLATIANYAKVKDAGRQKVLMVMGSVVSQEVSFLN